MLSPGSPFVASFVGRKKSFSSCFKSQLDVFEFHPKKEKMLVFRVSVKFKKRLDLSSPKHPKPHTNVDLVRVLPNLIFSNDPFEGHCSNTPPNFHAEPRNWMKYDKIILIVQLQNLPKGFIFEFPSSISGQVTLFCLPCSPRHGPPDDIRPLEFASLAALPRLWGDRLSCKECMENPIRVTWWDLWSPRFFFGFRKQRM